eukprot:m.21565 g.21565  ORF g.21565 m.21565 type:complete len:1259 (+) comp8733_c0_seq2:76-3852(+)
MGIPKYYRWVSQRYPCLSQVVCVDEVPQFDCLYLDMNGIIHNCTHANNMDLSKGWSEEVFFKNITDYIDQLFSIIKPCQTFYMAVDGCAPRAKMNQQRSRRFRSAEEAREAKKKAIREGKLDPNAPKAFDSNCITPGTPFMHRLEQHLQYFVQIKLTTDPLWKVCKVIFSGHDVPGEGEHKIMDYIRAEKTRDDYNPNTRHCLYGLDADLIMLGLVSHEPNCSLLREEVKFGKQSQSSEEQVFHLLSLSLYREYLNMEFQDLEGKISFPYDFERLLDDWILLGFFIGNDFLPHLPNFHISEDIIPRMYELYKKTMTEVDGWITEGGTINMAHLQQLLRNFDSIDESEFYTQNANLKHFGMAKSLNFVDSASDDEVAFPKDLEFRNFKCAYYNEKMGVEAQDYNHDFKKKQAQEYVTGLQWVYYYYFCGVPSWGWFYPSHYCPFVTDVVDFADFTPSYELGRPLRPFEQLMAVLPPASKDHVPPAYQPLMTEESSPIIDFYPTSFKTDLNGKRNEWEAVVLIPFIDEHRLLSAMRSVEGDLNDEERSRNSRSVPRLFVADNSNVMTALSPYNSKFPSRKCKVSFTEMTCPHIEFPAPHLGLLPAYDEAIYFAGFPTFRHKKCSTALVKAGVRVFAFESRDESFIITPEPTSKEDVMNAMNLVGQYVWVRYPHLVEAKVVRVTSKSKVATWNENTNSIVQKEHSKQSKQEMSRQTSFMKNDWLKKRGLNIGNVNCVVEVEKLEGIKHVYNKTTNTMDLVKSFKSRVESFPLNLVCTSLDVLDDKLERLQSTSSSSLNLKECFLAKDEVCYVGPTVKFGEDDGWRGKYGCMGTVMSVNDKSVNLKVVEPYFPKVTRVIAAGLKQPQASDARQVGREFGLPPWFMNRILSSIIVLEGSKNDPGTKLFVGLGIQSKGRNKVTPPFCMKRNDDFLLTKEGEQLLREYLSLFSSELQFLSQCQDDKGSYYLHDLLGGYEPISRFQEMAKFVEERVRGAGHEMVSGDSIFLNPSALVVLKTTMKEVAKKKSHSMQLLNASPSFIVMRKQTASFSTMAVDENAKFQLGDRVVCASDSCNGISWGEWGLVVGIVEGTMLQVLVDPQEKQKKQQVQQNQEQVQQQQDANNVVLDEARTIFAPLSCFVNASYGKRCFIAKSDREVVESLGTELKDFAISKLLMAASSKGNKSKSKSKSNKTEKGVNVKHNKKKNAQQQQQPKTTQIQEKEVEKEKEKEELSAEQVVNDGERRRGDLGEYAKVWEACCSRE